MMGQSLHRRILPFSSSINAACGADVFCNCDAFTDMPRIVLFLLLPFASPPWRRMASAQPRGHREIDCGEAPARPSERRQTVAALAQIWDPQTLASFSMSQLDGLSDVMCGHCPQLSRAFKLLGKGIDLCSRAGGERKRRENPKEEEEEREREREKARER
ncbi:Man1b1 [Symbiodinium necroappetens]|uniref:Man1b1 protein n=1 Tax=Symbiodinium necroappetens TaxID=1628268 RepID=A0A812RCZ4_9DINO|nr:Man1b1 [Symbiodinium necroappetens]